VRRGALSVQRRAGGVGALPLHHVPAGQRGAGGHLGDRAPRSRRFCPRCGSQLTFRSARWPDDIDVTLGTLDRAEDFPPDHHIFVSSRLAWLHLDEALPAYQGFGPGSPAK
jgi:hypothetical protein